MIRPHCSHIIIHFAKFLTGGTFKIYSVFTQNVYFSLRENCKNSRVHQTTIKKKNCASIKAKIAILSLRINRDISRDRRDIPLSDRGEFIETWIIYFHVFFAAIIFISFLLYFFFFTKKHYLAQLIVYILNILHTRTIDINNEHDCHSSTAELLSRSN